MIVADDRAYVGLLRVRGAPEQGPAARLRVSHLLGATDLKPAGMQAGATLVVRRLRDPLPGRLARDRGPGTAPNPQWEQAAQSALTDKYRQAVRPSEAGVSAGADAVVFVDTGELLACLARDLATGVAASRWWWAALLRALPADSVAALVAALCRDARFVPAALARLSTWGEATAVLRLLTTTDAWRVFEAVVHAYDLARLTAPQSAPGPQPPGENPAPAGRAPHEAAGAAPHDGTEQEPPRPPWEPAVAPALVPESLPVEARALLGVSLLLHRAPAVAYRQQFADDFAQWRRNVEALGREATRAAPPGAPPQRIGAAGESALRQAATPVSGEASDVVHTRAEQAPPPKAASEPGVPVDVSSPGVSDQAVVPVESTARSAALPLPQASVLPPLQALPGAPTARAEAAARAGQQTLASESVPHEQRAPSLVHPPPVAQGSRDEPRGPAPGFPALQTQGLDTELGGLLFLIQLLHALGIPRDLGEHFGIESRLGGWGWLELVGRCLLDRGSPELAGDPIWNVLAALDGRQPGTALPQDCVGKPDYRLPESWLADLPVRTDGPLELRQVGRRWQLWDPAGYVVAEGVDHIPAGGTALVGMTTEARRRAARRSACRPLGLALWRELERFLEFVLPYVRWRLLSAMRFEETEGALAAALLKRRGRMTVTATHVDLTMALDLASGAVRRAGLDTDPGWIPELGRIVVFHYV